MACAEKRVNHGFQMFGTYRGKSHRLHPVVLGNRWGEVGAERVLPIA
jgi:hypothetical protein